MFVPGRRLLSRMHVTTQSTCQSYRRHLLVSTNAKLIKENRQLSKSNLVGDQTFSRQSEWVKFRMCYSLLFSSCFPCHVLLMGLHVVYSTNISTNNTVKNAVLLTYCECVFHWTLVRHDTKFTSLQAAKPKRISASGSANVLCSLLVCTLVRPGHRLSW